MPSYDYHQEYIGAGVRLMPPVVTSGTITQGDWRERNMMTLAVIDVVNPTMLRLARESRGLSRAELAEMIAVPREIISRYEAGYSIVTPDHLQLLSDTLRYPVERFMEGFENLPDPSICIRHYVPERIHFWIWPLA